MCLNAGTGLEERQGYALAPHKFKRSLDVIDRLGQG